MSGKHKHWRGVSSKSGWNGLPVADICGVELRETQVPFVPDFKHAGGERGYLEFSRGNDDSGNYARINFETASARSCASSRRNNCFT